jgi:hypothetical protein
MIQLVSVRRHGPNSGHCKTNFYLRINEFANTWTRHRAVGTHVLLSLLHLPSSLPALVGYPVAMLFVGHFETTLIDTSKTRGAFERLLENAQQGIPLEKRDIRFVTSSKWEKVPWKVLPISVDHYDT